MHTGPFEIDFKFGRAAAIITEANHMHLDFNGNANRVEGCGVTIRGIKYHGGIHIHLWADGLWHIGAEYQSPNRDGSIYKTTDYQRRQSAYLRRVDSAGRKWDTNDITEAGFKLLAPALELAVNEWYKIVEPSGVFQIAQRRMLHRAYKDLLKKEQEAAQALASAQADSAQALAALNAAGGPVPIEEEE